MDPFKGKGAPGRPAAHDRPGASAGPVLVPSEALRLPGEDLTLHCLDSGACCFPTFPRGGSGPLWVLVSTQPPPN